MTEFSFVFEYVHLNVIRYIEYKVVCEDSLQSND